VSPVGRRAATEPITVTPMSSALTEANTDHRSPSVLSHSRLDWTRPLRHPTFYKAVYRPAVLRANRIEGKAVLLPELKFHALRHTYASLSVAAGIKPAKLSGRMGHANVRTTLDVYTHLFPDDDATEDMAAAALS
jgi:integrase